MTDDDLVGQGFKARALLETPLFVESVGSFMQQHLSAILSSADNDAEGREKSFKSMRCYESVLADLRERVIAADKIVAAREGPQGEIDVGEYLHSYTDDLEDI